MKNHICRGQAGIVMKVSTSWALTGHWIGGWVNQDIAKHHSHSSVTERNLFDILRS